jgi:hypothetical protein
MSAPRLLLGLLTVGLVACASVPAPTSAKIRFPLDGIRTDGLSGPAGGLVSIDYEFCVPADPRVLEEVKRLDPSVKVSLVARGRIVGMGRPCASATRSRKIGAWSWSGWRPARTSWKFAVVISSRHKKPGLRGETGFVG